MSKPPQDPLQPVLRDAEAELRRRLREACEAEEKDIENKSAAEIRRLEDALLGAAVAAENTLTLRRHVKRSDQARRQPGGTTTASEVASPPEPRRDVGPVSDAESLGDPGTRLREFKDSTGQTWRAWPITPGLSRLGRTKHFLGDYQLGWVCFEDPAAGRRRRLPGHPERWSELTEQELDVLLQQAITVRERNAAQKDAPVPGRPVD